MAESRPSDLHINHAFVLDQARASGGRILDFGCGAGDVVAAGQAAGLDIWGVDNYWSSFTSATSNPRVFTMNRDGTVPFPNQHFDFIASNQVLEHVADLRLVLSEMRRMLKPKGAMLHLFPSLEVWREGHCEVPFAHRFHGRSAYHYLLAARAVGMGAGKKDQPTRSAWAESWAEFLRSKCFYRTRTELESTFRDHGFLVTHDERAYIVYRASRAAPWLLPVLRRSNGFSSWMFQRLAFDVFRCRLP